MGSLSRPSLQAHAALGVPEMPPRVPAPRGTDGAAAGARGLGQRDKGLPAEHPGRGGGCRRRMDKLLWGVGQEGRMVKDHRGMKHRAGCCLGAASAAVPPSSLPSWCPEATSLAQGGCDDQWVVCPLLPPLRYQHAHHPTRCTAKGTNTRLSRALGSTCFDAFWTRKPGARCNFCC